MSARELQEECKRRDLPSARDKQTLVQRLTDADTAHTPTIDVEADFDDPDPGIDSTPAPKPDPAPAPAGHQAPPTDGLVSPGLFRSTFSGDPDGPFEEEHLAFRQSTRQAAVDAGHEPLGDAYRIATTDGLHTYTVHVRQVT